MPSVVCEWLTTLLRATVASQYRRWWGRWNNKGGGETLGAGLAAPPAGLYMALAGLVGLLSPNGLVIVVGLEMGS